MSEELHNTSDKDVNYSVVNEAEEYNNEIGNIHPYLDTFKVKDNNLIVRLFKYTDFATTDGGIIVDNEMEFIKDSQGQIIGRRSINNYQARGIVVSTGALDIPSEFYNNLLPGSIVRLQSNNLGSEFDIEPTTKGFMKLGYFLIHISQIIGSEDTKIEIKK